MYRTSVGSVFMIVVTACSQPRVIIIIVHIFPNQHASHLYMSLAFIKFQLVLKLKSSKRAKEGMANGEGFHGYQRPNPHSTFGKIV